MKEHAGAGVRVFAVWQPMLATDRIGPTVALRSLSDGRVQQYWDPDRLLAKRLAADARDPQPVQECCVRDGILWDLAAIYPRGAQWDGRLPSAVVFDGPVVDMMGALAPAIASAGR